MKISRGFVLVMPLLFLAACAEEAPEAISTETGGEAAGEILGGTISDEMIPLEELTSTSPPAAPRPSAVTAAAPVPEEGDVAPEVEAAVPEPAGPITAGPSRPVPQTQEAEESNDPPASR